MVAVDPRPETQVRAVAQAVWAQPVSRPGVWETTSQGTVEEWSRTSTSRRCQCSQGSRVRHDSSRATKGRPRSCVEARQGTEQSLSGEFQPRSGSRGHIRGSPGQGAEVGSSSPRSGRFPRPGSQCFGSSSDTCQSCRGRTSVECPGRPVPTVHRADCEAHRGVGQSATSRVRTVTGRAATVATIAA